MSKFCKLEYNRRYYKIRPWLRFYKHIERRCNSVKHISYPDYGGRGIKNLLTKEDVKILWFLDEAYDLKRPSIDRIDSDGNYTIENCRFIELSENLSRARSCPKCGYSGRPK